ncbi:MAG: hypothetical protein PUP91_26265 [Rhizonema sp. PD37]|nr:hypothetical protein [Rhizonema sp. PD37]
MNLKQLAHSLLLTSAVVALFTTKALSQDLASSSVDLSKASTISIRMLSASSPLAVSSIK